MIKIKGKGLRVLKGCHLLGIICWMGGSITSLMILTMLSNMSDQQSLRDVLGLLEIVDLSIIATAAMFTVGVGLIYGIFTSWRFVKVRWVLIKWILSLGIILTGTVFYIPILERLQDMIAVQGMAAVSSVVFRGTLMQAYVLFVCHMAAMIFMVFISVLRPWAKVKANK